MHSCSLQVGWLQVQRLQALQTFAASQGELIQQLVHRFALAVFHMPLAIERIKRAGLAVLKNSLQPRHPIRTFPEDQVANNAKGAPAAFALIAMNPKVRQSPEQRIERGRRAGQDRNAVVPMESRS